jgi:predicted transcriptional regulator
MSDKFRQVHVRLTEEQDVAITRLAMQKDIDKAEVIRRAIADYFLHQPDVPDYPEEI